MIEALLGWLVATFLLGPMQAQMAEQLAGARAPAAVVRQVTECGAAAAPVLLDRAAADPWWAVGTTFRVWIGALRPEAVLAEAAPACGPAMQAARPYLAGG